MLCRGCGHFAFFQLGFEGGVGITVHRIVGEGLRPLLAGIVIKELYDEGLLVERLLGFQFGLALERGVRLGGRMKRLLLGSGLLVGLL